MTAPSFVLEDEWPRFRTEWHSHRRHQLLYSRRGALWLEAEGRQWLVTPQRAAWLAAGVRHRGSSSAPVSLRTAYLARPLGKGLTGCCVFDLPPVGRAMLEHGVRWGPGGAPGDLLARQYFALLAALAHEWAAAPARLALPAAETEVIERAMAMTVERLGEALRVGEIARAVGMSARTFQRQFAAETGCSWRTFALQARMLRAMERLAAPGARVTAVASSLGFSSFGAFTRAFTKLAGEPPSEYLRRARG